MSRAAANVTKTSNNPRISDLGTTAATIAQVKHHLQRLQRQTGGGRKDEPLNGPHWALSTFTHPQAHASPHNKRTKRNWNESAGGHHSQHQSEALRSWKLQIWRARLLLTGKSAVVRLVYIYHQPATTVPTERREFRISSPAVKTQEWRILVLTGQSGQRVKQSKREEKNIETSRFSDLCLSWLTRWCWLLVQPRTAGGASLLSPHNLWSVFSSHPHLGCCWCQVSQLPQRINQLNRLGSSGRWNNN